MLCGEPRNDSKTSSFQEHLTGTGSSKEELFCLNSTRILILISILLSVLLISLVVTICTCVRAKELRRRLLHQSYPYGKVSNCS
ncbi:ZP domain-containing protein [Caerostris extrusa]|uniref:ZP domain-containing protein n=1 Tax=Caerostris extrusa TaxID=172846 RepID=A0AAV4Q0H6_CAEEX|nr:ZP domain-containing protein [Caerostris extrusa]